MSTSVSPYLDQKVGELGRIGARNSPGWVSEDSSDGVTVVQ